MASAETITVALSPEMAGFVRRAVEAGEYASSDDAIREALQEWKDRREPLGYTVEELRKLVREGIDSGPSPYASMDEVKTEARRRLETSHRKG